MYFSIIYYFLIFITFTKQDESVVSFSPTTLSIIINDKQPVTVTLVKTNVTFPFSISFRYNDDADSTGGYIDKIPDITFNNSATNDDLSQTIYIVGHREGHVIVTAQASQNNSTPPTSKNNLFAPTNFVSIDIGLSKVLDILTQVVGWIYFAAWSISFYPQIILNFRRRSVIGLNFDFLGLNILGHSCYSVFNVCLYFSTSIQQQYFDLHPHGVIPVQLNDVIFSVHAVFACIVTIFQCLFFERGEQRMSYVARILGTIMVVFLFISSMITVAHHLTTLDLLYYFSYVKLAITLIKYCPQAWMNFKRKSTEGWSIGNILLDLTGGLLSLLQMFFLAKNYDDWSSLFGSITKLGLSLFSIFFDLIFVVQHYILYRNHDEERPSTDDVINENSPILFKR